VTAQIPAQNTASIENNRRIISLLINVISEYMEIHNPIIPDNVFFAAPVIPAAH
jgi:hypothetical protein